MKYHALTLLCAISIAHWTTANDLATLIETANFDPITEKDLLRHRSATIDAVDALESRLAQEPSGASWKNYLLVGALREAISKEELKSNLETVTRVYYRLSALHDGLEAPEIERFRETLGRFRRSLLVASRQAADAEKMDEYQRDLEMFPDDAEVIENRPVTITEEFRKRTAHLAHHIRAAKRRADASAMRAIDSDLRWLRHRGQAPHLIKRTEAIFSRTNTNVGVSAPALADLTRRPVEEIEPIERVEDGVTLRGQAVVTGTATMHPIEGSHPGQCEVRFVGTVATTLAGYKKPVSFQLSGNTALTAQKRVLLSADQMRLRPSAAQASTNLRTERVCSTVRGFMGKIVRKIATEELAKENPKARRDLSRESADSFLERFDEDIEDEIAEVQTELDTEVHRSLQRLDLRPRQFLFDTDPSELRVKLQFGTAVGMCPPSRTNAGFDARIELHESVFSAVADRLYSGRRVKNFRNEAKLLGLDLREELMQGIPEGIGIEFSVDDPVCVQFNDDAFTVIISGDRWIINDVDLVAMKVGITYRLTNDSETYQLELADPFEITAPESLRGGRFFQQKNVLERRLRKELPERIEINSIGVENLPETIDRLGNLKITSFSMAEGWLTATVRGDRQRETFGFPFAAKSQMLR